MKMEPATLFGADDLQQSPYQAQSPSTASGEMFMIALVPQDPGVAEDYQTWLQGLRGLTLQPLVGAGAAAHIPLCTLSPGAERGQAVAAFERVNQLQNAQGLRLTFSRLNTVRTPLDPEQMQVQHEMLRAPELFVLQAGARAMLSDAGLLTADQLPHKYTPPAIALAQINSADDPHIPTRLPPQLAIGRAARFEVAVGQRDHTGAFRPMRL